MRYEVFDGDHLGTIEWHGPGEVTITVADCEHRAWLERYFRGYDPVSSAPSDWTHSSFERRDASERAFDRAVSELAGYACVMSAGDAREAIACTGSDFAFGGMGA